MQDATITPATTPPSAQEYCQEHRGWVVAREAVYMGSTSSISGPEHARYACRRCVVDHGLVPPVSPFVGRTTPPPIPPGQPA